MRNYPEGVDLVTALAGKVDKTTTIAGLDLQNNITKEELQVALDVDDKIDKLPNCKRPHQQAEQRTCWSAEQGQDVTNHYGESSDRFQHGLNDTKYPSGEKLR